MTVKYSAQLSRTLFDCHQDKVADRRGRVDAILFLVVTFIESVPVQERV